jgi:hypothetical protein
VSRIGSAIGVGLDTPLNRYTLSTAGTMSDPCQPLIPSWLQAVRSGRISSSLTCGLPAASV